MKNYFVVYLCLIFGVLSCNPNQTSSTSQTNKTSFEIEISELELLNRDTLHSVLSHLDSAYNYLMDNDREINVLYITQSSDSVLFNFSIFPEDCIQLFIDQFQNAKVQGYWRNEDNYILLVFDDTGIFETKTKTIRSFNFGYQEKEYPLGFEPPLYRYYLNRSNQLVFVLESWFLNYY